MKGDSHMGDRWTRVAFVVTLVIFAAIAVSAYVGMNGYLADTRSVTLSRDLHMKLDDLVSSLKDIQRGARGYVITQDTAFLQPFRTGAGALDGEFADLRRCVDSSAAERLEMETLRALGGRLLAVGAEEVELTRRGAMNSARAAEVKGLTKYAMDSISTIVAAIQRQEEARRADRLADAGQDFHQSVTLLVLGTCLSFVVIVGVFLVMNRQVRERRESEEKLRLIFENARDGISIFEEAEDVTQRRLVDCNPRYADLAGRSRVELLARGTTQGLAVNPMQSHSQSIRKGTPFRGSFSWLRPDGRENIIEYTAVPIELRGKKYTIGIDRDVTEERRAEDLVHASRQRYQALFEASPIPLLIYDTATLRILEVNPVAVEHYGYTRAELLGMTVKDIRPPEELTWFAGHLQDSGDRAERTVTTRHRKKDGSIIQAQVNSHAIEWDGRSARLVLVHDITELLQVEEELKIQKAHFQRLFESAPEGIALLDAEGIVRDVNRAFVHMFGRSREQMIGTNVLDTTVPEEGKEDARSALEAVMDGVTVHLEAERVRSDGRRFTASIVALPVEDSGGARTAYVLYRDITQKKRWDTERDELIHQLQKALTDVKTLGGLLPICAWCKKIRDDQGYYHQIETFIAKHSDARFTHGICPECRAKFDREAAAAKEAERVTDQAGD